MGSSNAELKGLDFVQNNNAIQYQMKKSLFKINSLKSDPGYQFDKLSVWSIPLTMGKSYTLTLKDSYNDGIARPGYVSVLLDGKYLKDNNGTLVNNVYKYGA